jgi:hypothetical protein
MSCRRFLLLLIFCLATKPVFAQAKQGELFDAIKVYTDKLLVMNDFIEFSEFDMSEIKFVNEAAPIGVSSTGQAIPGGSDAASAQTLDGEAEIKALYDKLPQYFYVNLKREIYRNNLPVTLFPTQPPAFSKPIKLLIKIKKINLKPYEIQKSGNYLQPVSLRIYGQIKDKETDTVLLKYYDTENGSFTLGHGEAAQTIQIMIEKLMRDLVLYLKPKY